ncbi:MAG: hypothetical protein ILP18_07830 [Treponema sp.]|nr:hypothetical protein [Treponema sp.]
MKKTVSRIGAVAGRLVFAAALASSFCLACCKSTPKELVESDEEVDYVAPTDLNPIALLSGDSSIYARLPAQKHKELVKEILVEEIPNIQPGDIELITSRLGIVWTGQGTVEDRSRTELIATGNIPSIALSGSLTKAKGWSRTKYTAESTKKALALGYENEFRYYSHPDTSFKISLMYKDLLGLAGNIEPLLDRCAVHQEMEDNLRCKWISQESDDILFFITRPGQYLRNMIGSAINISTDYIYGNLRATPSGDYNMTMNMHISDARTIPALKSMLNLAFGLTGGTVSQADGETLVVSGVPLSRKQIVGVITRDPITGKHYNVVDGKVVEENVK